MPVSTSGCVAESGQGPQGPGTFPLRYDGSSGRTQVPDGQDSSNLGDPKAEHADVTDVVAPLSTALSTHMHAHIHTTALCPRS